MVRVRLGRRRRGGIRSVRVFRYVGWLWRQVLARVRYYDECDHLTEILRTLRVAIRHRDPEALRVVRFRILSAAACTNDPAIKAQYNAAVAKIDAMLPGRVYGERSIPFGMERPLGFGELPNVTPPF